MKKPTISKAKNIYNGFTFIIYLHEAIHACNCSKLLKTIPTFSFRYPSIKIFYPT